MLKVDVEGIATVRSNDLIVTQLKVGATIKIVNLAIDWWRLAFRC